MIRYTPQRDGEWFEPKDDYRMACCDCGSVHRFDFRIVDGNVQFRAWRDRKATNARRKQRKVIARIKAMHGVMNESD